MNNAPCSPNEALALLREGNERFHRGKAQHPRQDEARRTELKASQHPWATVFTCSDSRVNEVIAFDCGLGDIFSIRTAGHVVDDAALASLEFSVDALSVPLLVVMGHEQCGAVAATLSITPNSDPLPGRMPVLAEAIGSHIAGADLHDEMDEAERASEAMRTHVRATVSDLVTTSTILAQAQASGNLIIVGAVYNIKTGVVEYLQ